MDLLLGIRITTEKIFKIFILLSLEKICIVQLPINYHYTIISLYRDMCVIAMGTLLFMSIICSVLNLKIID